MLGIRSGSLAHLKPLSSREAVFLLPQVLYYTGMRFRHRTVRFVLLLAITSAVFPLSQLAALPVARVFPSASEHWYLLVWFCFTALLLRALRWGVRESIGITWLPYKEWRHFRKEIGIGLAWVVGLGRHGA